MRIGIGYDAHRLAEGRDLVIGGAKIPFDKGLLGHSDADVLIHAIMDALLGAMAKGDIGKIFPDNNAEYKNISSLKLLAEVKNILDDEEYKISNIDTIIVAEKPKLAAYVNDMRKNIAACLKISISQVSVKATTEEGLGFTGSGEGIAAKAICLIERNT